MKEKLLNAMQTFSRAIVVPILFLPVIGILLAISSILSNPAVVGTHGYLTNTGNFIGSGLWPILNNLSLVFCVGMAVGMAKEKKAEASLIALFSYLVFLGANHEWLSLTGKLIKYQAASDLAGTGQTVILGFQVIDMGVFLGIILGVVVALVHNKFYDKEMPGAFGAYGNTKLVFMALVPLLLFLAAFLNYIWPFIQSGITSATKFMDQSGSFGLFIYGFLNRFLIPTGLHHLIYTPFSFSNIGGELLINGKPYFGATNIFMAQLTDPAIQVFDPSSRYLQYGMVKIFGLVGAATAFYRTAEPENKKRLKAILIPSVVTSVVAGITEPLEFTFLFASPLLWFIHSVMDGLFQVITVQLGARTYGAGGLIDFLSYNLPAGISRTRWPVYLAVGMVQLGTYYIVFRFFIKQFNLKTPGRENTKNSLSAEKDTPSNKAWHSRKHIDGRNLAGEIVRGLGGAENIESVDNCFSRLRVKVKDSRIVDESILMKTGAAGVIKNGRNIQVVYGPKVSEVRNSVEAYLADR
ncbi:PTS transporter subunit EIIC [Heyndrickxia acidiproducens]|uniref:PTS transporter subunit EIIC n=1 Tax=Heyndrickxia acidiproducens TaxID=1121084 RepID=UPI00036109B0|nr:PTS transporter subunit EIIC [Heyndrickxia acidiproducens]